VLVSVPSWIVLVSLGKERSTKAHELNTKLLSTEIDFRGKAVRHAILVQSLMEADLIDEYRFLVDPITRRDDRRLE